MTSFHAFLKHVDCPASVLLGSLNPRGGSKQRAKCRILLVLEDNSQQSADAPLEPGRVYIVFI